MKLSTTLGNIDLKNYAAGKQAQCLRLNNWGEYQGDAILKLVGEGKGYTKEEAEMLIRETVAYRKDLVDANIPIPQNLAITTHFNGSEHQIVMVDCFMGVGEDVKQALAKGFWIQPVTAMINFVHDLPSGQTKFATKVMGDFKPDNFVYSDKSLFFIDYFAPKRVADDGLVTPYLDKIDTLSRAGITFLCGDRRGQISRLLALIKRDHPKYFSAALTETKRVYSDMPEILNFIEDQVYNNFKDINDIYQSKDWSVKV